MGHPAIEQPARAREFRFEIGPLDTIPVYLPQNRIGEACGRSFCSLHEFHGLMHDRMGRQTLQIPQLEDGRPECLPHFGVELANGLAGIVCDQVIELSPEAESPEYNLAS